MRPAFLLAAAAGPMLAPAAAMAAPQTFNTALPVATGEWVVRLQGVAMRADAPMGGKADANGALAVAAYGIDGDTALFAAIPWFDKSLRFPDGTSRGASGFGDLRLFVRRSVYAANGRGHSFRIAPFAGVEIPTGRSRVTDRVGRLPPALQPGSGSLDPFGGVVTTWQTLNYEVDGQVSYQANRRALGFKSGSVFDANASFQYRLWPRKLGGGLPNFVYATLDAGFRSSGRDELAGQPVAGTSAKRIALAPGLQYVTRRWIAEVAVEVPVWRDVGPLALDERVTVFAGLRAKF